MLQSNQKSFLYLKVAVVTMARRSMGNVGTILEIHQVLTHIFMAPGIISGQLSDVVPLIVRGPGEIHSIDLGATTQRCTARIQYTPTISHSLLDSSGHKTIWDVRGLLTVQQLQVALFPHNRIHWSVGKRILGRGGLESGSGNAPHRTAMSEGRSQRQCRFFVWCQ